jgi:hypothetical protein
MLPASPAFSHVARDVYLGNLKAVRSKESPSLFDAVLNVSCKTATHIPATLPYASVEIPDSSDATLLLPKLIYASRWLVEQVRVRCSNGTVVVRSNCDDVSERVVPSSCWW